MSRLQATLERRLVAAAITCAVCVAVAPVHEAAIGQAQSSEPTFEVASVKRRTSRSPQVGLDISRGQVRATNVSLTLLIRQAYEVMDSQIVSAPAWTASDRFDVVAKAPEGTTDIDAMRAMLRSLLRDRFQLAARFDTREMPVYALVRAREDGRLGDMLRLSSDGCGGQTQPPPGTFDDWNPCGVMMRAGQMNIGSQPMKEIVRLLSSLVGRTILDVSGITGQVQMRLRYQPGGLGAAVPAAGADEAPNVFTALQEQTGLRLEPRRAPARVLVIDRLEQPSED